MKKKYIFNIAFTAIMASLATALMYVEISIPVMPFFVKLEVSDFPALVAANIAGPVYGVLVCLIKCLLHLPVTYSGGVGELVNFVLGASFVLTSYYVSKAVKGKAGTLVGGVSGAAVMALISYPMNYYVTYPVYSKIMELEQIIAAYTEILPAIKDLPMALLVFNVPFNLVKGLLLTALSMLVYTALKPLYDKYMKPKG